MKIKICKKCSKEFNQNQFLEGKIRCLNTRKFCLECSPYKLGNNKNLNKSNETHKTCPLCSKYLKINSQNFYIGKNRVHSYCKKCNDNLTINKQRKRKQIAVDYKGGKCICCGYNKYIGSLDFHHLDPDKKDFNISNIKNYALNSIKSELDKCILVCSNCHREIHGKVLVPPAAC